MGVKLVIAQAAQREAGRLLAEAITLADAATRAPRLAIPGGSAVEAVRSLRESLAPDVWNRLRLTWVDERCVPFSDPDSNRGSAVRAGILTDAQPVAFELPLWRDDDTPDRALARLGRQLEEHFDRRLDVLLLGLGEDGHIASLFPKHRALRATGGAAYVDDSPKPPPRRITLTLDLLGTARTTVLLVTGEKKRDALERLLAGDVSLPVNSLPELTIVTDLEGVTR